MSANGRCCGSPMPTSVWTWSTAWSTSTAGPVRARGAAAGGLSCRARPGRQPHLGIDDGATRGADDHRVEVELGQLRDVDRQPAEGGDEVGQPGEVGRRAPPGTREQRPDPQRPEARAASAAEMAARRKARSSHTSVATPPAATMTRGPSLVTHGRARSRLPSPWAAPGRRWHGRRRPRSRGRLPDLSRVLSPVRTRPCSVRCTTSASATFTATGNPARGGALHGLCGRVGRGPSKVMLQPASRSAPARRRANGRPRPPSVSGPVRAAPAARGRWAAAAPALASHSAYATARPRDRGPRRRCGTW